MKTLCLILFVQVILFSSAQSDCPAEIYTGNATIYAGAGTVPGACSFPINENLPYICAMNADQYNTAALCGSCLEVTGAQGTAIVYVVEEFPEGNLGSLDFNQAGFEAIVGNSSIGIGPISWKVVSCPLASFPLELTIGQGSNPWYHIFQIHRHVNPVSNVEEWVNNAWVSMTRQSNNAWVYSPSNISTTNVRVTDIFGEQITIPNVDLNNATASFYASTNFTECNQQNGLTDFNHENLRVLVGPETINIISSLSFQKARILDLKGTCVMEKDNPSKSSSLEIEMRNVESGIYLIEILDDGANRLRAAVVFCP